MFWIGVPSCQHTLCHCPVEQIQRSRQLYGYNVQKDAIIPKAFPA